MMCSSRFIVKLYRTYNLPDHLGFLLELAFSDLASLYNNQSPKLDTTCVRYHIACVGLVLEYLHHRKICFRDVKPENALVDWQGVAKLCDFGIAKQISTLTYTVCGTPEYMAPEMWTNAGYDHLVDYFALGVMMRSLLQGCGCINPAELPKEVADAVGQLCNAQASQRLVASGMRCHGFWRFFDWGCRDAPFATKVPPLQEPKTTAKLRRKKFQPVAECQRGLSVDWEAEFADSVRK